ncbi:MAG TPA: type III pantothenate kinase [Thermodesulfovibrio thiophilus]|nr:type III pantothenate kinase [Thermodesulfovibrio thiophilus]HQA04065.1 type III pantothenate kinase [Thermodesulfovibrio thiophilus]HQD36018.1 type III pantothenate kinase [Thermodesulfovibrio thiophilus]
MLFAVEIGNSTINIAFFRNSYNSEFEIFSFDTQEFSLFSNANQTDIITKTVIEPLNRTGKFDKKLHDNIDCIICSVVPGLTEKIFIFFKTLCKNTIVMDYKIYTGLILKLDKPETFGVDRLASSVAAYELFKENLAVVDAGTATTITIVTKNGEILGGSIMPGIGTMNYALTEKTASLPTVDIKKNFDIPGKDTHSAILNGIVLGTVYAVEGIIKAVEKEINLTLLTILTGGYSELISKHMKRKHLLNKYLVIEGMRLIYLKNINFRRTL